MFDPKAEVPSLELCQRLKELGYPQEGSGWYWIKDEGEWIIVFSEDGESYLLEYSGGEGEYFTAKLPEGKVKAPTCRELGEILPAQVADKRYTYGIKITKEPSNGKWPCEYFLWYEAWSTQENEEVQLTLMEVFGESLAEVLAQAVLWLAENGYVKFEEATNDSQNHS